MPKSVKALTDILAREEKLLVKVRDTAKTLAHKESKAVLNALVKAKKDAIAAYKTIIKTSQKCPAVKAPAKKTAKKAVAKTAAKPAAKKAVKKPAKKAAKTSK